MVKRMLILALAALAVACETEEGQPLVPGDAGIADALANDGAIPDAGLADAFHAVTIVSAIGDRFDPDTVNVPVGGTVRWVNLDGHDHTVTSGQSSLPSDNPGALFDTLLAPGRSFEFTFVVPGSHQYFDRIFESSQMTGVVVVGM